MQLLTVLCYSYTHDMILITLLLQIKRKLPIDSGSAPPPSVKCWVRTRRVQDSCTENHMESSDGGGGPAGDQDPLWEKIPHIVNAF
jgi:hypothetical protein